MSAPTNAGPQAAAFEHVGFLYDPATGLAIGVLPLLRAALEAGRSLSVLIEPTEADSIHHALPPDAALTIAAPAQENGGDVDLMEHLRGVGAQGPALVLAQYSAFDIGDIALRHREEQINQQLAKLPITLICACSTGERSPRKITARATHPQLLNEGVPRPNSSYRRPGAAVEVGRGDHVLGVTFRGQPELHHVRSQARAGAAAVGLSTAHAEAWVSAVHEAAVIASENAQPDDLESCEFDMWAAGATITAELRGPRQRNGPPETNALETGPDPGHPAASTGCPDPLAGVRLFCHEAGRVIDGNSLIVRLKTHAP